MSVDSLTVDTEDWQGADSCTIGDVGGGLLGSEIVVGGFLYGDLTLPADANKEICGRITYWPPGLDLRTDEDGGLTAAANDGTYVAQYQLYVDYVATGPETPLTYTFGAISIAAAWTEGSETFAAAGTVSAPAITATLGWTEGSETFAASGTATAPAISAVIGWTEGADAFAAVGIASAPDTVSCAIGWVEGAETFAVTGTALGYFTATAAWAEGAEVFQAAGTVSAPTAVTATVAWTEGAESFTAAGTVAAPSIAAILGWTEGSETFAMAGIVINPITAAASWIEGGDVFAIAANVVTRYARAPAGNGYTPQRDERQSRPAAIQRNMR